MQANHKFRELRFCLANDLRGIEIEEHPDLLGFVIRDSATGAAMFTAYVAPDGYSSYEAIADGKGYDLADEKPLAENAPLFTAVAKIKTRHTQFAAELYPAPIPLNSNPQRAPHYLATDYGTGVHSS